MSATERRFPPEPAADPVRDRIATSIVELVGVHGYDATTIEAMCARAEVDPSEFRQRYESKEDCFLDAYDEIVETFGERVLGAYETQIAWHDKFWAAGWEVVSYLRDDPVRARFFAVEVNAAGRRANQRRDRVMQIFTDLIDAGRAELDNPESLSRATSEIVAGAIYFTIQNNILRGRIDRGEDFLVELIYIAMIPYLGADAAAAELKVHSLRRAR